MKVTRYEPEARTAAVELSRADLARILADELGIDDVRNALVEAGRDLPEELLSEIASELLSCVDAGFELARMPGQSQVLVLSLGPGPDEPLPGEPSRGRP